MIELENLKTDKLFLNVLSSLLPDLSRNDISLKLKEIQTAKDFQEQILFKIITTSVGDNLTFSGLSNIEKTKSYLFISNHREIFLDAGILQMILSKEEYKPVDIILGDNLIETPFINNMAKLCRMIPILRKINKSSLSDFSVFSKHIRDKITNNEGSLWIAQRSGRTKTGIDKTNTTLLKILSISGDERFVDNFNALNIIPVSISYEYEPCDIQKATLSIIKKKKTNDINNIISGITGKKGGVNLTIGAPINDKLAKINNSIKYKDKINMLAKIIDMEIISNYKLFKTNYMAYDILKKTDKHNKYYSDIDKIDFMLYIKNKTDSVKYDVDILIKKLLNIYANPVIFSDLL